MEEVGGDGFLILLPMVRRAIAEVTDGLAPALPPARIDPRRVRRINLPGEPARVLSSREEAHLVA